MKKLGFLLTALLALTVGHAQDFGIGVKGGINVASIGGSAYSGLGSLGTKVSFHLGGVAEVAISDKMAVQPELLYSSQGTKWSYGTGDNDLKLDYLNLPILGKYYFLEGLSAEAGPVVGFLISTNQDDDDRFKKLDVAFAIGASYKLNENIFFSLRYNKGIANINGDSYTGNSQNNVLQISAGYAF
ncbi:Outer membrane protein beta-barrel domain-containing protein [Zobellia uliginosa]|uniref:Outer membrane protein beta-barrel domain-containing protein n=1 Tax=Zobellia uliginosa TaxID=143224 RepID=A0ABY1KHX6_9FLAO|nr:porin family protein [Zobellia uliginosa]MDO6516292.1 porin family protein [Zobellia uliginosa]SIS37513.1 Outer membrane protein beta-barrel domain-containing protein [Zobellia uliginosa]